MAIKMVREPSETPNINNIDDIVPMRYAYGNQNGFVIGKGNEISNSVSGLNFTVNSGRLVLQGVECDIDATGVTIIIDNIATKRYYTIYLEVNLGLNTATIKSEYDTATYPNIDAGDDLTENTTGIARLPLYRFTATSGIIGEVNKVVESIKYINENFIKNVKVNNATNSTKINDISITRTDEGILKTDTIIWDADIPSHKVGDIIIPQYKVVYTGGKEIGSANKASFTAITSGINVYKTYEIELGISNYGEFVHTTLKLEFGKDDTHPVWFIISLPTQSQNTISMQMVAFYVSPVQNLARIGTLYGNFVDYWRNFNDDTSGCIGNPAYYNCRVISIKEVID